MTRIALGSLDPASKLAQRLQAAIARDDAARREVAPQPQPERWASEEALHRAIVGMIAAEAAPGTIEAAKLKGLGTVVGAPDLP